MKLIAFAIAACAALAVSDAAEERVVHIRVHAEEKANDAICYKWCPSGTYCVIGDTECRKPPAGKCLNPATSRWIDLCDPGFECVNGKCDYKKKPSKKAHKELVKGPNDICYKWCPSGTYCVIGDTQCRKPPAGKCLNPATSRWIDQCDPGFECVNGKCDYKKKPAKKAHKELVKGPNDICYKWCPSGTYCVIGDTQCRKPPAGKCLNPATSRWIDQCDPGFECVNGKCDYKKKPSKKTHKELVKGPNDICYKACPSGTYCVIGDTECRKPPAGKCLNPATSRWIDQCDPGFECVNGKCDYKKKPAKNAKEMIEIDFD